MKNLYLTLCGLLLNNLISAQEEFVFPSYNGTPINLTATSSRVNDDILITLIDADIIENFYTEGQTEIYLYGGLDTDVGAFQGSPDINNLNDQPMLTLATDDSDANTGPNTYTIAINLAQEYSAVSDGSTVYGLSLSFQNELGGGGNNQTVDLYIDLIDSTKDSTLSVISQESTPSITAIGDGLHIRNILGSYKVIVFDVLGRRSAIRTGTIDKNYFFLPLPFLKNQINLVKFESHDFTKTVKLIAR